MDDWRALSGPRFFRYAVRLGAYSGVIAARAYEAHKAEQRGGAASSGGMPSQAVRDDPNLVSKLAAEGWIEHRVEKG